MKLFLLKGLMQPGEFAQFAHVGTWSDGDLCPVCGVTSEELIPPLLIEWEPGTDNIGDFAWCSIECVVRDSVRDFFTHHGFECSYASIRVVPPVTRTRVSKRIPRVAFPYHGPHLHWVRPKWSVPLDEQLSGVSVKKVCPKCGVKQYATEGRNFVIRKRDLGDRKMFKLRQFQFGATYLTEDSAELLNSQRFTGYRLDIAGRIID